MSDAAPVVTVGELSRQIRLCLERGFSLLWVAGEVSNLTRAASGHVYFSLKDETAQVRCVMFRLRAQSISWRLENGQQVEARALVTAYEPRGELQLNVETLRQAGVGRLFEAFAQRKAKLEGEGLFDPARKRPLPRFPRCIGIVSSVQAAALRDVLAALRRRAPHLGAILYPARVQGEGAAAELAAAIAAASRRGECDVVLLVRGGGSIEDLWAFNEEVVARAIVACALPVICGVGHETDTTIADYAADQRAATPTAAAELATAGWHQAAGGLVALEGALARAMRTRLGGRQQKLDYLALRLIRPQVRLARARDRLELIRSRLMGELAQGVRRRASRVDRAALRLERAAPRTERVGGRVALLAQRLTMAMEGQLQARRRGVAAAAAALAHLSPRATLARGFAIVRDADGCIVTDAAALRRDQKVTLHLAHGAAEAGIIGQVDDSMVAI